MPIDINELKIVNYCHPNCEPFKNIVRLPKKEAFLLAGKLAMDNPNTTSFYRFADFKNYYDLRMKQDTYLHELFISMGGNPQETHPLSFVLQDSEYLNKWFDGGTITKIYLKNIPDEFISFTLGDSGSAFQRTGSVTMITKEKLYETMREYKGTIDEFMSEIVEKHHYIEVQLWSDKYCMC